MFRCVKKISLFFLISSIAVTPGLQAGLDFQSVKKFLNSCRKNITESSAGKFVHQNASYLSLMGAVAVASSCLVGTETMLKITGGAIGAVPYGAYKLSEKLGPQKTIGLSLAAFLGIGFKHYMQFSRIANKFNAGLLTDNPNDENFLFATWKPGLQAFDDIQKNAESVKTSLKALQINGCNDKQSLNIVEQLMVQEKELLEKDIAFVGQYTDLPIVFVQELKKLKLKNFEHILPDAVYSDKACAAICYLVDNKVQLRNAEFWENSLLDKCKKAQASSLYYAGQWSITNPFGVTLFPCSSLATDVCMQLFKGYSRVCAFAKLLGEIKAEYVQKKSAERAKILDKAHARGNVDLNKIVNG